MSLDRIILITLVFILHIAGIYVLQKQPSTTAIAPQAQEIVVQLIPSKASATLASPNISSKPKRAPKKSAPYTDLALASRPHITSAATVESSVIPPMAAPSAVLAEGQPDSTTSEHSDKPAPTYQAPLFNASYLNNPPPSYPPVSRQMQENGTVILRVHVDIHGSASAIELRTSSGSKRLDNAAIEAVRHWRFVAAKLGNEAIAAWVLVPIIFQLDS